MKLYVYIIVWWWVEYDSLYEAMWFALANRIWENPVQAKAWNALVELSVLCYDLVIWSLGSRINSQNPESIAKTHAIDLHWTSSL